MHMQQNQVPSSSSAPLPTFKIVLLGCATVGKSSIYNRLIKNTFTENTCATIGIDFNSRKLVTKKYGIVNIQIWDTAGQERFLSIQDSYLHGADICLLVASVDNETSLENLKSYNDLIKRCFPEKETAPKKMLILNKYDLLRTKDSTCAFNPGNQTTLSFIKNSVGFDKYTLFSCKYDDGLTALQEEIAKNIEEIIETKGIRTIQANTIKLASKSSSSSTEPDQDSHSKRSCCH
jgi:small GTP-binding protein